MIKLDLSVVIFFYLLFTVILVFILWVFLDRKIKSNTFKIGRKNIWQCAVCKYVYIDPKDAEFSRCPRCKSMNKKGVRSL